MSSTQISGQYLHFASCVGESDFFADSQADMGVGIQQ